MTKSLPDECPRCGETRFKRQGPDRKTCANCRFDVPARECKPGGKVTPSQQKTIDRIHAAFGGHVTRLSFVGRKAWVTMKNRDRDWVAGDTLSGTIGVRGAFHLVLTRFGGNADIRDDTDLEVYLKPAKRVDT